LTHNEDSHRRIAYLRQLARDSLKNYSGGFAGLERVARDIESIIRSLEEVADPSWTSALLRKSGQLEIMYAMALHEGRSQLTQDEEDYAREVVAGLLTEFANEAPSDE
jgi:hypothetical protein